MTLGQTLRQAARAIAALGSDEASLEAELLMMHATGLDRVHLYQRLDEELMPEQAAAFQKYLERRLAHEPVPYIVGHKEFFGLEFQVAPCALIPRPETETLVELVIAYARERGGPLTIADIGTGTGIIAVALASALPEMRIVATDISEESLALARRNAERHGVADRITFAQGDLLDALREPVDVIAANLPYVTTVEWEALPPEIREYEPRSGLDGGPDGLRVIERMLSQAPDWLRPGGALFEEIGDTQGPAAAEMARRYFPDAEIGVEPDLAGRDRVLVVRTRS